MTGEHVLITLVPLLLAIGNWIIMVRWKLNLLAAGLFSLLTKIVGVDFSNLILVMFFLSFLYMLPWVESTAGSSYLQMKLCRKHCRPVSDTGLHWSASSPMVSLSPWLHLPPDLDARYFDVCVIYLLAATVFSVCFGMLGRGHLAPASLVDGMVRMTHLHTTCLLKWLRWSIFLHVFWLL